MARKELTVEPRQVTGKKVAQLRRAGILPANVYGRGIPSVSLQITTNQLHDTIKAMTANEVLDLKIAGERAARPVVIHHVQRHPLTSGILHAEFYQVSLTHTMRADVPLVVVGTSDAVTTFNGVLMTALESLQVEALPLDLPSRIEVDITSLVELEQSLHVRDLPIPANVTVLTDPDVMVVKISSPRVAEEGEEAAEGEEAPVTAVGEEAAEGGGAEASESEGS